jgi:hypothetical protein
MAGHPNCFAQALGNCAGESSGEHYVSDAILRAVSRAESRVPTFLPAGVTSELGIRSPAGNILCQKHHSDLSGFDDEGLNFFNAMERVLVPGSPVGPLQVSGDRLERWALKTLIGGLYSGQMPTPEGIILKGVSPPDPWLDILFQNHALPPRSGLYLIHGEGGEALPIAHEVLKVAVLPGVDPKSGNLAIIGLRMLVFGLEFALCLANLPDPLPEGSRLRHATYRPTHITRAGETLVLDWAGNTDIRPAVVAEK